MDRPGAFMAAFRLIALLIFVTCIGCGSAFAEKRVALVIGNSAYRNVARLTNPANDAAAVATMLRTAGFDTVESKLDLSISDMRKALRDFGSRSRDADVAVVYYAGHGIELDGTNYLIPVDATLETDADVLDETLPLDRVLFAVEPARQLRLVILDACRDNPFAKTMKRTIASRGVGRGLAKVEPNSSNTMIAFAARAGSTASDGNSRNSPFAAALVEHLPKPGLDLRKAFGFVRDDVLKATNNSQEPFIYGSLGGNDVSLVPAKPVATGPQPNPQDAVRRDYELALQLGTRDGWNAFLAQYPEGFYANLAKGQLSKIAAEQAREAAAEKARQAEQDKARLAAEGARQVEQAKAAAAAKAAEEARLAAEKAGQIELAKSAAAELARIAAEKAAADKLATERAAADRKAADKAQAEKAVAEAAAKPPAEKQAATEATGNEKNDGSQKVASLPPSPEASKAALSPTDVAKSVQLELRRVGCLSAVADGEWNVASQRSMTLFNKYAGTKLDVKLAGLDAVDTIKAKPSRVCPLVCDHGFKDDGERCVKITCRAGFQINEDNECKKVQEKKPAANREEPRSPPSTPDRSPKAQATGGMLCNNQGCRPVSKGCRVAGPSYAGAGFAARDNEVCN
jgi:uncharacterized caspase-like protein